jgi:hypothetical protein
VLSHNRFDVRGRIFASTFCRKCSVSLSARVERPSEISKTYAKRDYRNMAFRQRLAPVGLLGVRIISARKNLGGFSINSNQAAREVGRSNDARSVREALYKYFDSTLN